MGRARCFAALGAAFVLDALVLPWFPLWGVRLRLLPSLVALTGGEEGGDWGAWCGLLGGILCYLWGSTPWQMAFLTALGALAGALFHKGRGFWGKWGACLAPLAAYEGLLLLQNCLAAGGLSGGWQRAGAEFFLSALAFPLAYLFRHVPLPGGGRKGGFW